MSFNSKFFRQALASRQAPMLDYVQDALRAESDEVEEDGKAWLNLLFNEVEVILKDPAQHPQLRLGALEFVNYLILMGSSFICSTIEQKLYPYVKNMSQYDKHVHLEKRGQFLFKNHPGYLNGSAAQKEEFRRMGIDYVRYCLESVAMWNTWLPKDLKDPNKPSAFSRGYQQLLRDGFQFPQEKDYKFYTKRRVQEMEKKVNLLIQEVVREIEQQSGAVSSLASDNENQFEVRKSVLKIQKISQQRSINLGLRSKLNGNSAVSPSSKNFHGIAPEITNGLLLKAKQLQNAMTESVTLKQASIHTVIDHTFNKEPSLRQQQLLNKIEQLKRQLEIYEKQRIISQQALNSKDFQLRQATRKLEEQSRTIQQLKITESQLLRQLQIAKQNRPSSEITQMRQSLYNVRAQNDNLKAEYQKVVAQMQQLEKQLRKQQSVSSVAMNVQRNGSVTQEVIELKEEIRRLRQENKELKMSILSDCVQSMEFYQKELKRREVADINFRNLDTEDFFEPHFSSLLPQEQIRLRKSMLKNKELLLRTPMLQVGCTTEMQPPNKLHLKLFITNVSQQPISDLSCELVSSQKITSLHMSQKALSMLTPNYQQKLHFLVEVNHRLHDAIIALIKFNHRGQNYVKNLLLPVCQVKMIQTAPYSADGSLRQSKEKTFELDTTVLSSIDKLDDYYQYVAFRNEGGIQKRYLRFSYLNEPYEWMIEQRGRMVRLQVKHVQNRSEEAEQLLKEWAFALQRQIS